MTTTTQHTPDRLFEVRCAATADIIELWRVEAADEEAAIDAIQSGQGEFICQTGVDNERDRSEWDAQEIDRAEFEKLSACETLNAAAPDLLAALKALVEATSHDIFTDAPECTDAIEAVYVAGVKATAAIAKAEGRA